MKTASLSLYLPKYIAYVAFHVNVLYIAWTILSLSPRAQKKVHIKYAFQIEIILLV